MFYAPAALCGAEVAAEVTVQASKIHPIEQLAPTAYASEIDSSRYAGEFKSVADALGDTAGVSVRRYGGLGAFATFSVRGSSANQVQVYFDGIPLSRAQNEVVDLADLPIDSLERIEVYRGVTPLSFPVAGLGGVVNLVPRREEGTRAQAGYGSFTSRKATATQSSPFGNWYSLAHVAYTGSAGNFRYRSDNDTPQNPFDDRTVTRVHNSFDSVDFLLNLSHQQTQNTTLDLVHETFWKDTELPGRGANPSLHASASRLRILDAVRWKTEQWPHPSTTTTFTVHSTVERSAFRDPFGELGAGQQDRDDLSWALGADGSSTWYPLANVSIGVLAAASHEWFWPENDALNAPAETAARRLRSTFAVQPEIRWLDERLTLVPGFRWEHVHDATDQSVRTFGRLVPRMSVDRDLLNPGLGVAFSLGWGWTLLANAGRYERAPNLVELFGLSGTVIGNPSLVPEKSWNRDVGLRWRIPQLPGIARGQVEYAYFDNEVQNLVVFVQRSAAVFRPENVGRARLRGHEVGGQLRILGMLEVEANYTSQDAENRSRVFSGIYLGKQLPGRPRHELYVRLGLNYRRLEWFYEFNQIAGNALDLANFQRLPARNVHGSGIAWRLDDNLRLLFHVRNFTDDQIADVGGFPLPGRSWFATVSWNLPATGG
jgi:iron complex outermembrane receptor protein